MLTVFCVCAPRVFFSEHNTAKTISADFCIKGIRGRDFPSILPHCIAVVVCISFVPCLFLPWFVGVSICLLLSFVDTVLLGIFSTGWQVDKMTRTHEQWTQKGLYCLKFKTTSRSLTHKGEVWKWGSTACKSIACFLPSDLYFNDKCTLYIALWC